MHEQTKVTHPQPEETGGLGHDDVVALRMADYVVFSHYQGEGTIRASLSGQMGQRVYGERDQRVFPLVGQYGNDDRTRVVNVSSAMYGWTDRGAEAWRSGDDPRPCGFAMIGSAHYAQAWQTVASLLRRGDRLELEWAADNNTESLRKAGLHSDELHLVVQRADGSAGKARRMVFLVAVQVSPDGSGRMVVREP